MSVRRVTSCPLCWPCARESSNMEDNERIGNNSFLFFMFNSLFTRCCNKVGCVVHFNLIFVKSLWWKAALLNVCESSIWEDVSELYEAINQELVVRLQQQERRRCEEHLMIQMDLTTGAVTSFIHLVENISLRLECDAFRGFAGWVEPWSIRTRLNFLLTCQKPCSHKWIIIWLMLVSN